MYVVIVVKKKISMLFKALVPGCSEHRAESYNVITVLL